MSLLQIINEMREEASYEVLKNLDPSMHLKDDLGLDSLMLAELTVRIEDEFDIDIFEDSIVQTIGEIQSKIVGK
ncbi:acyl carrier protein [Sporosarcina sp. FSL K6-5500]|uniref:acyl carrier protein n=1 Tax=Sporosarcina sp. FSL K6-5500 TaxID=2921558 RepID=UPI0030F505FA